MARVGRWKHSVPQSVACIMTVVIVLLMPFVTGSCLRLYYFGKFFGTLNLHPTPSAHPCTSAHCSTQSVQQMAQNISCPLEGNQKNPQKTKNKKPAVPHRFLLCFPLFCSRLPPCSLSFSLLLYFLIRQISIKVKS